MTSFENSQSSLPKRQRADSGDSAQSLQYDDYTVGWISALPLEMTAAQAMLDHRHEPLYQHPQDSNCYEFGSINDHNVVIACLPKAQYGNNNAAIVANNMNRTFPHLQYRLLVGIAGGAPGSVDVRLGDVVVSTYAIQYDLGKAMPNSHFQHIAEAIRPPQALLTAVSKVEARHNGGQVQMLEVLSDATGPLPHYGHPMLEDCLFHSEFTHTSSGTKCDSCDRTQLVSRVIRSNADPVVHYGRVASGNQVIKDALTRDSLSQNINNICFEMEAAGVMDCFPCLVIRGICDYSDSHKNKGWQEYAALVAAAYAKELLMSIPPQLLQPSKRRKAQPPTTPEHIDPEADECLRAMFVTDPSLDREGILDAKGDICEGTCEWILSTEEFQAWDQDPPHLLWISAPPGMGKTFMAIYLSKHFEGIAKESDTATIFFFCDNKIETRSTAVSVLRGLMHQLISHQPNLVNTIIPQWKQQSRQMFLEKSFGTLWRLFEDAIAHSNFRTIYCVIDGLDECEASSLSLLLRKFERLSQRNLRSAPKMKLICLSRRYPDNIPETLFRFAKIELDIMSARQEDVNRFISVQVQGLVQKKQLSRKMCSILQSTFLRKSEGTFLWVSYMSQDLQKQKLIDFEASLAMLPAGLDAVYDRILQSIEFDKRVLIHGLLYWILVAKRPLAIAELCEAVDIQHTRLLTREEVCIELIKSCGHLLQITDGFMVGNCVHQTVTFLHQSAKDYLTKLDLRFGPQISNLAHPQLHEHATIILIQYLGEINCRRGTDYQCLHSLGNDFKLAEYAIKEWSHHFRELEDISQVMRQGLSFFEKDSKVRRMWQLHYRLSEISHVSKPVPLLHLSAFLGLNKLAEWCLRSNGEHNVQTGWGTWNETALLVAYQTHHHHIFNLLLDAGANAVVNGCDDMNGVETTLFGGILLEKKESFKKYLLEQTVDECNSLINLVADLRNLAPCRFLMEDAGWNFNLENGRAGYSALASAMHAGQFEFVKFIIREWDILPEHRWDILKMACSSYSTEVDFEEIIRFLVGDGCVDVNATDGEGHNALCTTVKGRRFHALSTTRTLLQFGFNPDRPDSLGRTSMHCLVIRALVGYFPDFSNIMELLVSKSQDGVNQVCLRGQTILHYLVEGLLTLPADRKNGSWYLTSVPQIAKGFLELGVDRHIQNRQGFTSLQMLRAGLDQLEKKTISLADEYWKCVKLVAAALEGYYPVAKDECSP